MRYGFAIKALPKGGKPFGDDEEDDEQPEGAEEDALEGGDPSAAFEDPAADTGEDPGGPPAQSGDPAAPSEDPAAGPSDVGGGPPAEGGEQPVDEPEPPVDDARPWAGDMYDEGDETDPADSFSAYTGSNGEQAWLDRAPDGTLTGWVRDSTGQVWRYTDPDAWAVDVDGAHMTRTHSQADEPAAAPAATSPGDRGVQDSMFQQGS